MISVTMKVNFGILEIGNLGLIGYLILFSETFVEGANCFNGQKALGSPKSQPQAGGWKTCKYLKTKVYISHPPLIFPLLSSSTCFFFSKPNRKLPIGWGLCIFIIPPSIPIPNEFLATLAPSCQSSLNLNAFFFK